MKASIIIPAWNEEKYIKKTLDAVFAQNYADFEVIVVDNGSTDNTHAIALASGAKVIQEKRKGTMWACECGRLAASGDVIVRLDADCIPPKQWLSDGMHHFLKSRVVGVTGPYHYFDGPRAFRVFSLISQKYGYLSLNKVLNLSKKGAILIGGNSFMRAKSLEDVGGFNTEIVFYGDDTDVAMRLSSAGKIIFDKKLIMKTSARRFKAEGTAKISTLYIFHFFRTALRSARAKRAHSAGTTSAKKVFLSAEKKSSAK